MRIENVSIVGMGALGVMYGDFFTKKLGKEHVEFVADKARIDRFQQEGIFCNGHLCDFSMADEAESGRSADLLIFAVKATGLQAAIHTVRNKVSRNTIILSLLNGITSEEIIGKAYGMDPILHCIVQGMDTIKVGVNQSVMIYEGTYETVQQPGHARDIMKAAMQEVIQVAQKENVPITQADFDEYLRLLDTLSPAGMPSMRQDGLAHRKSEVELFAGTVLALAEKHKIDAPVNRKIYETILTMERAY